MNSDFLNANGANPGLADTILNEIATFDPKRHRAVHPFPNPIPNHVEGKRRDYDGPVFFF